MNAAGGLDAAHGVVQMVVGNGGVNETGADLGQGQQPRPRLHHVRRPQADPPRDELRLGAAPGRRRDVHRQRQPGRPRRHEHGARSSTASRSARPARRPTQTLTATVTATTPMATPSRPPTSGRRTAPTSRVPPARPSTSRPPATATAATSSGSGPPCPTGSPPAAPLTSSPTTDRQRRAHRDRQPEPGRARRRTGPSPRPPPRRMPTVTPSRLTFVWSVGTTVVKTTPSSSGLTDSLNLSVAGNGDKGQLVSVAVTPSDGRSAAPPRARRRRSPTRHQPSVLRRSRRRRRPQAPSCTRPAPGQTRTVMP